MRPPLWLTPPSRGQRFTVRIVRPKRANRFLICPGKTPGGNSKRILRICWTNILPSLGTSFIAFYDDANNPFYQYDFSKGISQWVNSNRTEYSYRNISNKQSHCVNGNGARGYKNLMFAHLNLRGIKGKRSELDYIFDRYKPVLAEIL